MDNDDLTQKHCKVCEGGTTPLSLDDAHALLAQLHDDWALNDQSTAITRTFHFKNYYQTMAFVNAAAWVAHQEDHHPDMEVGYNRCRVDYRTHAIGGLSENDFICAAKIDRLFD
ncbi:MAG: 4a-hydroxytetrahydrobiopterin dehydratase [Gammaproteobacteria bacterium]